MDFSKIWLGAVGGGFSASAVAGGSIHQITMWNMGGDPVPVRVLITGKRVGLMAQAEAAHALCIVTGVKSLGVISSIRSSGIDWALAAGLKADSFLDKNMPVVADVLRRAQNLPAGTNWASQEGAKAGINRITGDNQIMNSGKADFMVIPTPLAVGVGAGVWYEWLTLRPVGGDLTWDYVKPKWRVTQAGGKVILRMSGIPEQDGTPLVFRIRTKTFGFDDTIVWSGQPGASARHAGGRGSANLLGRVYGGKLYGPNARGETGEDGFDLSALQPVGKLQTGMLSVSSTSDIARNGSVKIGVSVCAEKYGNVDRANNLYRWGSDGYVKVTANDAGRLVAAEDMYWMN